MTPLTEERIEKELSKLPHWDRDGAFIVSSFRFADFLTAIDFVGAVAELAEKRQHHPNIIIEYDTVTLELSTQRVQALTETDIDFAHAVELLQLDYDAAPADPGIY